MFVFGVILVPIQSKCGKIRTRITPNTNTSHIVLFNVFLLGALTDEGALKGYHWSESYIPQWWEFEPYQLNLIWRRSKKYINHVTNLSSYDDSSSFSLDLKIAIFATLENTAKNYVLAYFFKFFGVLLSLWGLF